MDNNTYSVQQRRSLAMDGLRSITRPPKAAARTVGRPPAPNPKPQVQHVRFKPKPQVQREHRLLQKLQMPLLLLAGTVGGLFAGNAAVGLALLAIYGVYAFATRIPSRTTFTLALLLLAAISLMLLLKPNPQLISNFASYAFVLLLIGVVTLGREAKMPKRMSRKYRR